MPRDPSQTTYFRQARFSTRLPNACLYSPAHYWLEETTAGVWRVGLTRFATRMLGDFVELSIQPALGDSVSVGEAIGTIEGFKAVTDVYCSVDGEFHGINAAITEKPDVVDLDPYDAGWLYAVRGTPADNVLDVTGYIDLLNVTIEKMLAREREEPTC